MAQRLSRAKQSIKTEGGSFPAPTSADRIARLPTVLRVLYLTFNEGYSASSGPNVYRVDLSNEAIRAARLLGHLLPDEPEVMGLLALMLLTDARRAARVAPDGALVPLVEQDRARWDRALAAEGAGLVASTLATTSALGPYQLQAAIAAVHVEAASVADTDWAEILALYELLARVSPGPLVSLGKAVAVAMVHGPAAGLAATDQLADALARHHRFHAVRGHLLEMSGDTTSAADAYRMAARYATNAAEKRYLDRQSRQVRGH